MLRKAKLISNEDLPQRDDAIYKGIEAFESFELTQSVAYEMMIRNKEFRKDKLELILFDPKNNEDNDYDRLKNMNYIFPSFTTSNTNLYTFPRIDTNSAENECIRLGEFNTLALFYKGHSDTPSNYQKKIKLFHKKWGIIYNDEKYSFNYKKRYAEKRFLPNPQTMLNKKGTILKNNQTKKSISKSEYTLEGSRPKIILDSSKIVSVELNLSLPLNELTEQIKFLKNEAEKNQIVSKASFYDKEFNQVGSTSKQRAKKWADYFYVYDALDKEMPKVDIQKKLYNYYYDMNIKTKMFDNKTINSYQKAMINFIDNMGYKELLTDINVSQTI